MDQIPMPGPMREQDDPRLTALRQAVERLQREQAEMLRQIQALADPYLSEQDGRQQPVALVNNDECAVDYDTVPGIIGKTYNTGIVRTDGSIWKDHVAGENHVTLSTAFPRDDNDVPDTGVPLPTCTEFTNPWIVAYGIKFPWRFKQTGASVGKLLYQDADTPANDLTLLRYWGAAKDAGDITDFPVGGEISVAAGGTGRTYYWLSIDLRDESSTIYWQSGSAWPTADTTKYEIVEILHIDHYAGSIVDWINYQMGVVRLPRSA